MRLRSLVCPEPDGAVILSDSVGTDLVRSQRREQEQRIAAFWLFLLDLYVEIYNFLSEGRWEEQKNSKGTQLLKDEVTSTRGRSLPQNEPKVLEFISVLFHAVAYLC